MRTLILVLAATSVLSANLRSSQSDFDFQEPFEQVVQVFQQAYNNAAKSTERQFIKQLYPDNADTVQAEVDACEDQLVASFMDSQADINADITALFSSCNSDDIEDLANQLLEDTITSMLVSAEQCDFSVDLFGDINRIAIAAVQQGFSFTEDMTGSLQSWANASVAYEPTKKDIQPYTKFTDTVAAGLGVSQGAINQADDDAVSVVTTLNQVVEDVAKQDEIPQNDAVEVLDAGVELQDDYEAGVEEAVRNLASYVRDAVKAVCSIVQGN